MTGICIFQEKEASSSSWKSFSFIYSLPKAGLAALQKLVASPLVSGPPPVGRNGFYEGLRPSTPSSLPLPKGRPLRQVLSPPYEGGDVTK